jgi:phage-related protein
MRQAGYQLARVQRGEEPSDWKPMPSVGSGVIEIRVHEPDEYRVVYVSNFADAIYVLHAFGKKTQKTPDRDLDIARKAYAQVKKVH